MKRLLIAFCLAVISSLPAHAEDKLWIATGELFRSDYYASLGALIPFPGSHLGDGWVQRYWLDTFTYHYLAGDVTDTRANVYGAEAMFGYAASRPTLSGAIYAGLRYSHTALSPDDPSSDVRGNQLWPKVQAEGTWLLSDRWKTDGIVAYVLDLDGYWARARLLYKIRDPIYVGAETVSQGDPNYNARKLGVVATGFRIFPHTTLGVRTGYRWQSQKNAVYGGLELVGEF